MNSAVSAGRIENRGSKPLISILVPVFNEAAILDANVREIIAYCVGRADRFDFELLVIIDGASDNSAEIADRLATEFASIRVLRHPTNFGVGQALRYGFSQSKGDIAIVLDVDLSYGPEHIELLVDKMVSTRAKLVLAAPYMPGGRVTNVPWIRRTLSRWGNRFLRVFARGGLSTLTSMVRAYDGPFVRSLALRSTGMDLMPEAIYKTMILRGRIEQVPAHLDWSKQLTAAGGRTSSMSVMRHIVSTIFSGFLFRPFMFLVLPGLALLVFALYVIAWMFIHFFEAYFAMDPASRVPSVALAVAFAAYPHTFVVALLSLMLAIQVIGLGVLAIQAQRYYEEVFSLGTRILRAVGKDGREGDSVSDMFAASRRVR